jgi:hypothetical protein
VSVGHSGGTEEGVYVLLAGGLLTVELLTVEMSVDELVGDA